MSITIAFSSVESISFMMRSIVRADPADQFVTYTPFTTTGGSKSGSCFSISPFTGTATLVPEEEPKEEVAEEAIALVLVGTPGFSALDSLAEGEEVMVTSRMLLNKKKPPSAMTAKMPNIFIIISLKW